MIMDQTTSTIVYGAFAVVIGLMLIDKLELFK